MTIQCCKCKRVRSGDKWQSHPETDPFASHTYCPVCLGDIRSELQPAGMSSTHSTIEEDTAIVVVFRRAVTA